jgi:creatinine amidohydrolase/Fe(II)-dependent formamide hydrolase-like protein
VRDAGERRTAAIYYAGSTEQNGPHLALGKHNVVARYVAGTDRARARQRARVPGAPFAPTGDAQAKTGHEVSGQRVSDATFGAVAREVALSAISAGFRNVVLIGDHGDGQDALKRVATQLDKEWGAKGAHVYYIGDAYYKAEARAREYLRARGKAPGAHAGIEDTSAMMFLDKDRKWVRRERLAAPDRNAGVDGDPREASSEIGKAMLEIKVESAVAQIRSLMAAHAPRR